MMRPLIPTLLPEGEGLKTLLLNSITMRSKYYRVALYKYIEHNISPAQPTH